MGVLSAVLPLVKSLKSLNQLIVVIQFRGLMFHMLGLVIIALMAISATQQVRLLCSRTHQSWCGVHCARDHTAMHDGPVNVAFRGTFVSVIGHTSSRAMLVLVVLINSQR